MQHFAFAMQFGCCSCWVVCVTLLGKVLLAVVSVTLHLVDRLGTAHAEYYIRCCFTIVSGK